MIVVCPEKAEDYPVNHSWGMSRMWWNVEVGVISLLKCLCGDAVVEVVGWPTILSRGIGDTMARTAS